MYFCPGFADLWSKNDRTVARIIQETVWNRGKMAGYWIFLPTEFLETNVVWIWWQVMTLTNYKTNRIWSGGSWDHDKHNQIPDLRTSESGQTFSLFAKLDQMPFRVFVDTNQWGKEHSALPCSGLFWPSAKGTVLQGGSTRGLHKGAPQGSWLATDGLCQSHLSGAPSG